MGTLRSHHFRPIVICILSWANWRDEIRQASPHGHAETGWEERTEGLARKRSDPREARREIQAQPATHQRPSTRRPQSDRGVPVRTGPGIEGDGCRLDRPRSKTAPVAVSGRTQVIGERDGFVLAVTRIHLSVSTDRLDAAAWKLSVVPPTAHWRYLDHQNAICELEAAWPEKNERHGTPRNLQTPSHSVTPVLPQDDYHLRLSCLSP